ncbi:MAG: 4Fe-4S dicluster domain-containing protein [Desulfobacteraceae bacterium]
MPIKISPKTIDRGHIEKIGELSGQNVHQCFQCGTCGGSCPMAHHMDALPRKIMHLLQLGLTQEIEMQNTCLVCSSCHACSVRCPRGVDLARVMEAIRLMTLRKNQNFIEPSQLPAKIMKEYPGIAMVSAFRKLTS